MDEKDDCGLKGLDGMDSHLSCFVPLAAGLFSLQSTKASFVVSPLAFMYE